MFCCFSFIIAMVNIIPCLCNSGGRRLRESWGGPIQNRLCILRGPIRNRPFILGRPIQSRLCNLGGPIRNVNQSKSVRKAALLLGISLGLCPQEILRSNPASHWKTMSFPPPLLRLTQSYKIQLRIYKYLVGCTFDHCKGIFHRPEQKKDNSN